MRVLSAQYQALVVSILINLYGLSASSSLQSVSCDTYTHTQANTHTHTHRLVHTAGSSLLPLTVTFSFQIERYTRVTPALNANVLACALSFFFPCTREALLSITY